MDKNEIQFKELLTWQKEYASIMLDTDKFLMEGKGRRTGKTFVRNYIIQELKKRDSKLT